LEKLPTISALAEADDDQLHKLWEGLGYYSRVRNLKKAAQVIMDRFGGKFPERYEDVLALPGIGEYTAGAVCSIAFDQPTPAVDGNVLRVVSRLLCDETPIDSPKFKKAVRQWLEEIYPSRSGDFTQALMELGATLCGPNWKPRCEACPCREFCLGHLHGTAESLPVKSPKRGRRKEQRTVFILSCDGQYALQKRTNKGLLAGLWQFPNVTGKLEVTDAMKAVEEMGLIPTEIYRQVEKKHIFTHIEWEMRGIYMEVKTPEGDFSWFSGRQTNEQTALPTAFRQFWEEIDNV
jgi:A/G-specific adenine glycosylase